MPVVLIAYDGSAYGWDSVISVGTGTVDNWVEVPGSGFFVEDAHGTLKRVLPVLPYEVGRERRSGLYYVVELPRARSPERVEEALKHALEVVE